MAVAGLLAGAAVLPEERRPDRRLDLPGQVLAAVLLGALVYGTIEVPRRDWSDPAVWTAFATSAAVLPVLLAVELRRRDPMLEPRLFADRVFIGTQVVGAAVSFGLFGSLFFLSLLMQQVLRFSPTQAGVAVLPSAAMVLVGAPVAGWLADRFGGWLPMALGLLCGAVGLYGLHFYGVGAHYPRYVWTLPPIGLSAGLALPPLTITAMARLPESRAAAASAMTNTSREVGGTLGVAVLGSILSGRSMAAVHRGADTDAAFVTGLHLALAVGAAVLVLAAALALLLVHTGSHRPTNPPAEGRTAVRSDRMAGRPR